MKQLILASQSPRRKSLLTQLGYHFSCQSADIDESVQEGEQAKKYVLRLAEEKATAIFSLLPLDKQLDTIVLGADTSVMIGDEILGKPENEADCVATLLRLSNNQHQVLTAIAVVTGDNPSRAHAPKSKVISKLIETQVKFKPLTLGEIKAYWRTGEPSDKAGSYAIQGVGGQFVTTIKGSYSAVVGLPLYETVQLLDQVGIPSSLTNV